MGCASSKKKRCRHCGQAPDSPVRRSYSVHVHHPPHNEDDSHHLVALTSSTLGSLKVDISSQDNHVGTNSIIIKDVDDHRLSHVDVNANGNCNSEKKCNEFSMGLMEAKNWSEMINGKIPKIVPKTPIRTPPGEPETINTWELMEGLEDTSPFLSPKHFRSFSFPEVRESSSKDYDHDNVHFKSGEVSELSKPMWLQSDDDSDSKTSTLITDFDPDIISSFRKSLEELPPDNPFYLRPLGSKVEETQDEEVSSVNVVESKKKVEEVVTECDQKDGKDKVVFYFTSLRGIRKTFEDCCSVRIILKSMGVRLDERDVSLHSGFKEELRELLENASGVGLPKVFVGRKYIGGAEEIRQLHEDGQLEKLLEGCEKVDGNGTCEACNDIRFLPCETCSGSCKIYYDKDHEEEEEDRECDGFQRCPDCNENGLIRCPICCD